MQKFCECTEDGYCKRFARVMAGRFREICAGINVDLGTAAAFREQWAREAASESGITTQSPPYPGPPSPLLLVTDQAPGDTVVMTAAIYSLHKAYPGRYLTDVVSLYPEVFEHNPHVISSRSVSGAAKLHMHYPAIHQSNQRGIHFMQGWCEHLGMALGHPVPLLTNRPHLYFNTPPFPTPVSDYWLVCSGGKRDLTNKLWGQHNYQQVTHFLKGKVGFIQVGANADEHPRLDDVYNLVGRTTLRELFELVRRARGVVCGVSLLMHVAAALDKPAIIIAGGREPVQWNAYPKQHYLHTVGMLPCSSPQGDRGVACWRSRTIPLGDNPTLDKDTCERPVDGTPTKLNKTILPECMTMIKPETVADLILMCNRQYEHTSDS